MRIPHYPGNDFALRAKRKIGSGAGCSEIERNCLANWLFVDGGVSLKIDNKKHKNKKCKAGGE